MKMAMSKDMLTGIPPVRTVIDQNAPERASMGSRNDSEE